MMGRSRTRKLIAWKTALAMAAATPVMPITPTPRRILDIGRTAVKAISTIARHVRPAAKTRARIAPHRIGDLTGPRNHPTVGKR